MKKIKTRDPLIPKTANFTCENCNTEFESSEFGIDSTEIYIRDEKAGWFSKLNRVYYTKLVYILESSCPVCDYTARVQIDRGLPEKGNQITDSTAMF